MAMKLTVSAILGLSEDTFPSSSAVRKQIDILCGVYRRVAEQEFSKRSKNDKKVIAELNDSIAAADQILSEHFQAEIKNTTNGNFNLFAINFFVASLRSLFVAMATHVSGSCKFNDDESDKTSRADVSELVEKAIDELLSIELHFAFGSEPTNYVNEFQSTTIDVFRALLGKVNLSWYNARTEREEVLEQSVREFSRWLNSTETSSAHTRAYLNYDQQVEMQGKILEEVKGVAAALADWISPSAELAERKVKAWNSYREYLSSLPDEKITMFDEKFGVRKVFVQPEALYWVAGTRQRHKTKIHDVAAMLGTLLSNRTAGDDLILLCGGPGSGKSTFCRFLASELSQNMQIYPIFLRLRRMEDTKDFIPFLEENLQRGGVIDKISDLSDLPNVVLILDGFDELVMASRARLREFFNALKEDLSSAPLRSAKVIVSGRDTLFPNGSGLPTGAHVVSISQFDKDRIARWGEKWRSLHNDSKGKSFKPEEFVEDAKWSRSKEAAPLEHLVSWPLTLHLVARAHTSGSIELDAAKSDQIAKAILYRSIVDDTALRQSEQSSGEGRLGADQMRKFVSAIAWEMYRQGKEALDLNEGLPILKDIFPDADESTLAELSEVTIVNQPELTKGEETGFEFVHKSFSEYFVAEKVATSLEIVSFKAQEWGGDVPTWRMSISEATGELAKHFAVRFLTAEVQEMLGPMLGDFKSFLKGKSQSDSEEFAQAYAENLEQKLHRIESLLFEFSKGNLLEIVSSKVPTSSVHASDLEAFANYAAGILLIGGSLCRNLREWRSENVRRLKLDGASFLRLLHIIQAGEINIDRTFANRALYSIDVDKFEVSENYFPPTQPGFLRGVKGLPDQLTEAVSSIRAELFCQQIWSMLNTLTSRRIRRKIEVYERERAKYSFLRRDKLHGAEDYLERILGASDFHGHRISFEGLEHETYHMIKRIRHTGYSRYSEHSNQAILHEIRRFLEYSAKEPAISIEIEEEISRMIDIFNRAVLDNSF